MSRCYSDQTPVAGQQFDYTFDTIGNRTQTQSGGDQSGAGLRPASYSANSLNQITSRDVPAYVDIKGVSYATNTVTVNGQTAYRKAEYFRKELPANNSSSALWTNIIVAATGQTSVTGNVFVAQQPEAFSYDADGNLTNDGRWAYTWDGENRLLGMTVNTNVGPQYKLAFAYDAKGRRMQKIVATNGVAISTNKFLYDGWNLIAETGPNNSLIRSYVWGTDLSGTAQDAGGVGGLLKVSHYGSSTTNCFVAYDGNGNVAALVNAADGMALANYEYGPFGEVIRSTGAMAKANPFRFSTKYQDDESDLVYYGYRYYKPSTGTWPNRDPIGELGFNQLTGTAGTDAGGIISALEGLNRRFASKVRSRLSVVLGIIEARNASLYVFVKNDALNHQDPYGLYPAVSIYGNYCGPGWCNRKKISEKACACLNPATLVAPRDSMDSCCKDHDLCLGPTTTKAAEQACDKAMCDCLKGVNPEDLTPPPGWTLQQVNDVYQGMYGAFCSGIAH